MNRTLLRIVALILIAFGCGTSAVLACMYGPPYRTVCETYAQADAVVVGTIDDVVNRGTYQLVSISIEKSYKGRLGKNVQLRQPLSSCDWDFTNERSNPMLLYLVRDQRSKTFRAIAQGMGGDLPTTSEDRIWLDGLPRSNSRTMVSGTITLYRDDPFSLLRYLDGVKVKIFNINRSYEVMTNSDGVYYIWDIPAGKYKISPEIPSLYRLGLTLSKGNVEFRPIDKDRVDTDDFEVEIRPRTCGGGDYVLYPAKN